MAVAHDAVGQLTAFTTSNSWTHTPTGTPKAIAVAILENVSVGDVISNVTYGGVAMTKVGTAITTSGDEDGAVYLFFLGSGVPTGAQTVSVTVSSGSTAKAGVSNSFTAGGNCEAVSFQSEASGPSPDTTVTLTHTGTWTGVSLFGAAWAGLANTGNLTPPAGWSLSGTAKDFGSQVGKVARLSNQTANDIAGNWGLSSAEDVAAGNFIIREIAGYELNAQPGTYSVSGAAMSPLAARMVNAQPGSYSLTGVAALLSRGFYVNAQPGSYSVTGVAATLLAARMINAAPGSYSVSGVAASTVADRLINAQPGTYSVSGVAAGLLADRMINAAAGSYVVTGVLASLLGDRLINAQPGDYAVTGVAATLVYNPVLGSYTLVADPGSYTMSGQSTGLLADRLISASPGAYSVTGVSAGVLAARVLEALPGTYNVTGFLADLVYQSSLEGTYTPPALGEVTVHRPEGSFQMVLPGFEIEVVRPEGTFTVLESEPGQVTVIGPEGEVWLIV